MKPTNMRIVPGELPDPPYPPTTRVRGWKFQLDHERLNQSDTWALAPPEMRPWLLMIWVTAWQQTPAGSFSDDDQVIAAKIGMDQRQFSAHRDILMRGWKLYSDGRLYHETLIELVENYGEHNRKERERMARWRGQQKQAVTEYVTRDKRVSTTPEPEPEPEPKEKAPPNGGTGQNSQANSDRCPAGKIVDLWHELMPELAKVNKLTATRRGYLNQRWREDLPDLNHWRNFFLHIRQSPFLMGKVAGNAGKRPFRATLDWVTRPNNFAAISEEKYHG